MPENHDLSTANRQGLLRKLSGNTATFLRGDGTFSAVGLTSGVSGILPAANGGFTMLPLMDYGGYGFDGSTDYLDGNALTGIADGKKGTWFGIVRFANAASAIEVLFQSSSGKLVIRRTSSGNLQVLADNAASSTILSISTAGTPMATAGSYRIMVSFDLATAASARIYINDTQYTPTETTFTDDTIDYTVAEYAVGATPTGTSFFAGDIYTVWFDPTSNLEFNTESVRRRFIDVNQVPVFLGRNGELPTGTSPILFLGYDAYTEWKYNRGSTTTTFVENGTPSAATTALNGQFGETDKVWRPWTPTRTGWTDVGTPTVTARYSRIGHHGFIQVRVVPNTTVATVAGTSYISLPVTATGSAGDGSMQDLTTLISIGTGVVDTANSRMYLPTQTATGDTLLISGWYEV